MSTIALQLELPESTFEALKKKAAEANKPVPQFALEVILEALENEAKLARGRAILRSMPVEAAKGVDMPSDLAENHDEYLSKAKS